MDNTEELYWIMFDVGVGTPEEQVVRARELLMSPTVDVNYKTERGDFSDDLGVGDRFAEEGKTALMNAIRSGRIDLVQLLLETRGQTGLDLDLQDEDGMTALMYAAFLDEPVMVMGLINNGANLDKTIHLGRGKNWTALDLAIKTKESGVEVNPRPWRKSADSFLNTIYILERAMLVAVNREKKRKQRIKNMTLAMSASNKVHSYIPYQISSYIDGEDTPPTVEQMEAWKVYLKKDDHKGTKEEGKVNAGKIKKKGTKKIKKKRKKRRHRKTKVR
tara:strand:- start:175 stop:999 length:825 start_codon:yes stop_codon:yes gene_type:complete